MRAIGFDSSVPLPTVVAKESAQRPGDEESAQRPGDAPAVGFAPADGYQARCHKLGVDPTRLRGPAYTPASTILDILGRGRVVDVEAVNVPGTVVWVNFELARTLGFDVPADNRMSEKLHQQLIDALSYRLLKPGEEAGERRVVTMGADRYGGDGIGDNGGSGRAAFLPWGNLHIKGVGVTPLADVDPKDFQHSHGGAPMREGFLEAIWGEVDSNLFASGATQVLAVIDNGDYTEWPDGTRERRALIIRAGNQVRPAHLLRNLEDGGDFSADVFVAACRQSGMLVTRDDNGTEVPDVAATMRRVIDAHAKTAAEQMRWRYIHGAISTSNLALDGGQLDLATSSTQPRTAPVIMVSGFGHFGGEHEDRVEQLDWVYSALRRSIAKPERQRLRAQRINVGAAFQKAYERYLAVQYGEAVGLKPALVQSLYARQPELLEGLTQTLERLRKLTNPGKRLSDKQVIEDVAVVDIFHALQHLPEHYFADPHADHGEAVHALLLPIIRGKPEAQAALAERVKKLSAQLGESYAALMQAAEALAPEYYGSVADMARCVTRRAAFENAPVDALYRARLNQTLTTAIDSYEESRDPEGMRQLADQIIAGSLRSSERLLTQGERRGISCGWELERRTIDGISYAIRVRHDGDKSLRVALPVRGSNEEGYSFDTLEDAPPLQREQIEQLTYRFTVDGWQSFQDLPARLDDEGGSPRVVFDIPVCGGDVGRLEGVFHCSGGGDFWLKNGDTNFVGYSFFVPDEQDTQRLFLGEDKQVGVAAGGRLAT